MDQEAMEQPLEQGAMDGTSDQSLRNRRSNGWNKGQTREKQKERLCCFMNINVKKWYFYKLMTGELVVSLEKPPCGLQYSYLLPYWYITDFSVGGIIEGSALASSPTNEWLQDCSKVESEPSCSTFTPAVKLSSKLVLKIEGMWKPKNDAKSEFYPGFLSKIQNSRA